MGPEAPEWAGASDQAHTRQVVGPAAHTFSFDVSIVRIMYLL